jgi:hypothetical protein
VVVLKALQDVTGDTKPSPSLSSHHDIKFGSSTPLNSKPGDCPTNILAQNTLQTALAPSPPVCDSQFKTIVIDGEDVTFDISSVADPPAISFAEDVPRLLREWYASSYLTVAGHGIPIRHWDKFYMARGGIKHGAWDSFRSTWHNWKVC